jgi:hypothetical protein
MIEQILHSPEWFRFVCIVLAVIINFITGILYFLHALRGRNYDMALAIFISLYAIVVALLPVQNPIWNYLGVGYGFLFLIFFIRVVFWDIITKGTLKQRIYFVLGIALILLALFLAQHTTPPEFLEFIPVI